MFVKKSNPVGLIHFVELVAIVGFVGVLSGCGGGGGGSTTARATGSSGLSTPTPTPTATPTPSATPTPTPTPATPDYFRADFPHWASFPIKVRFDHSVISADMEKNLRQGMDAWKNGTGGKISYKVVEDSSADVNVTVANVGDSLHGTTAGNWFEDDHTIVSMTINLSSKATPLAAATQARIMAHEWGHALGLIEKDTPFGHSDSAADRMYPVLGSLQESNPILSGRDIKTIKRLYGL